MELLGARRSEFDLTARLWIIPKERVKNKREHTLPLSSLAVEVLGGLMEYEVDEWLYPSPYKPGRHVSDEALGTRTLPRTIAKYTLHDLRRTMATRLSSELGINRLVQDRILNHVDRSVSATYDRHTYDTEARDALQRWSERLGEIVQ